VLVAHDIAVFRMTAMPGRDFGRAQDGAPGIQFCWDGIAPVAADPKSTISTTTKGKKNEPQ
jgi:hypothetical protein